MDNPVDETPIISDTDAAESSIGNDSQNESSQEVVPASKLSASDVTSKYGVNTVFKVRVLDAAGKPLENKSVTFKVNGKTYERFSDSNGMASISFKFNAGKYTIKINNAYKIFIYKWKSGADVKKNKRIKKNIPNSALVRKVVKAAKKGTPLIKFVGGKGKKVFITAGVHGNELSSQVAAMRLIKYLESHPINGTVYVMPFMNPKGTAKNVRDYNGVHLNQKANELRV